MGHIVAAARLQLVIIIVKTDCDEPSEPGLCKETRLRSLNTCYCDRGMYGPTSAKLHGNWSMLSYWRVATGHVCHAVHYYNQLAIDNNNNNNNNNKTDFYSAVVS